MNNELRRLQLTQLEILKVIDRICREQGLHYSLYAGTLLGAVRHQGFIPWDDDLDICMPRTDYEHLIQVWDQTEHSGYLLQNKENSPSFSQSFTKIRKDHTTFLQKGEKNAVYHTGIFVDIFPIDRCPSGGFTSLMFKWDCMLYQLYTREFIPPKENGLIQLCCIAILACTPKCIRPKIRQNLLHKLLSYNGDHTLPTVGIETMASLCHPFPADMLDSYTELPFEDSKFMCFSDWDEHLKCKFGNYMQLPPEDERAWKHHPLLIDFEHNYKSVVQHRG